MSVPPLSQSALSLLQMANSTALEAAKMASISSPGHFAESMVQLSVAKLASSIGREMFDIEQELTDSLLDIVA